MRNNTKLLLLCLFWSALFCRLLALQVASPLSCAASNTSSSSSTSVCIDNDIPSVNALRGGDGGGNVAVLDDVGVDNKTRDVILRFLHYTDNNNLRNVKFDDFTFHIQGWRWHFMSLIRDSRRLERLSSHLTNILADETLDDDCISESAAGLDALHRAANYVINFNMAGLYRIQSGMFLSFLRDHLCEIDSLRSISGGGEGQDVTAEIDAFRKTIGKIDDYRVQSEIIGRELYERAKDASSSKTSLHQKKRLLVDVVHSSRQLSDQLSSLRHLQETLIVPAISRVVPPKVQKSFNNRVLLNLGILESRLHLVGMHDAVWESGIEAEKKAFENEIPYVARIMIERWRQSLYIPKAGALDFYVD